MSPFACIVRRDLLLAFRRRSDVFNTLVFFIIVVSLFPLGVGPEPNQLRAMAPGVIWVAALLASMLALNRLFAAGRIKVILEGPPSKLEQKLALSDNARREDNADAA